jgi:hypothetical protein
MIPSLSFKASYPADKNNISVSRLYKESLSSSFKPIASDSFISVKNTHSIQARVGWAWHGHAIIIKEVSNALEKVAPNLGYFFKQNEANLIKASEDVDKYNRDPRYHHINPESWIDPAFIIPDKEERRLGALNYFSKERFSILKAQFKSKPWTPKFLRSMKPNIFHGLFDIHYPEIISQFKNAAQSTDTKTHAKDLLVRRLGESLHTGADWYNPHHLTSYYNYELPAITKREKSSHYIAENLMTLIDPDYKNLQKQIQIKIAQDIKDRRLKAYDQKELEKMVSKRLNQTYLENFRMAAHDRDLRQKYLSEDGINTQAQVVAYLNALRQAWHPIIEKNMVDAVRFSVIFNLSAHKEAGSPILHLAKEAIRPNVYNNMVGIFLNKMDRRKIVK